LCLERLEDRYLPSNIVFDWTNLALEAGRLAKETNQLASRSLAILQAAIYDSVNAINPAYSVYHVDATAFPGASTASAEAAAAQAAHDVTVSIYGHPATVDFEGTLQAELAAIPDGTSKDDGIALGQYVAAQMLAWRANDGSSAKVPYTIGTNPGDWQPTPPNFSKTPATPQWPYVTPFAMTSGSQFRPGPPPELTSADYTEAFQEIKPLGGDGVTTPSTRTPEQTEIAWFWSGYTAKFGQVSNGGVKIWEQIAETVSAGQDLTLAENARLFAQLNVALADSYIAGFDAKYSFQEGHGFWRPVTAIRAADTDGNPDTIPDPNWTPLITTPNHPSYIALHACQSEAAAQALAAFFGTDHVTFTVTWPDPYDANAEDVQRTFRKFTEAAHEAGMSRIYGGIHWSFDVAQGWHVGLQVGQYVTDNYFLPITAPAGAHTTTEAQGRPALPAVTSDVAAMLAVSRVEAARQDGPWFSSPSLLGTPHGRAVALSPDSPRADAALSSATDLAPPLKSAAPALDHFFAQLAGSALPTEPSDDLEASLLR
jgi:hypothetical protein